MGRGEVALWVAIIGLIVTLAGHHLNDYILNF
jgi:hypothetical protein